MIELKYVVEDSTIAELLGVQNFTSKESAILELVKNAFDAESKRVDIIFKNGTLTIKDFGKGMSKEDIMQNWMHVGKSNKGYEVKNEKGEKRILAGSKGIGRFALARLGRTVELFSQKKDCPQVIWKTDWNKSEFAEREEIINVGTEIRLGMLRDKWTIKTAEKLAYYLGKTYNDFVMKINVKFDEKEYKVRNCFENPQIGINYSTLVSMKYDSSKRKLICKIDSDEFLSESRKYCKDIDINQYESTIDLLDEFKNVEFNNEFDDLDVVLSEIGNFKAYFYFGLAKILVDDEKRFLYKRREISEKYDEGIILYRNSFSISSYEGSKDWLELGKRSRKSPAASTHPTGAWRVRENQISGQVIIDKKENEKLQDLSNRQGLDENKYFEVFVRILQEGLEEFEYYRQSIIRKINARNILDVNKDNKVVDKIIKNPKSIKELSQVEVNKLVTEVKEFKNISSQYKKEIDSTEKRYKYDVRILNVLATSGLKATSIAHEMKNDRNSIDSNYEFIVKALKKFDLWECLNEEEKTKYAHLNIPGLLNSNKKINTKLVTFMDTMLREIERRQFFAEEYNMSELLYQIKKVWERDYSWINIEIDADDSATYIISEDIVKVIFDNLILNSVQQNERINELRIGINVEMLNGLVKYKYFDNGIGLHKKYLKNPHRILEVHETSSRSGHGLGMWIVNNTISMSGGEIISIAGHNGFAIEFTLGGKV